MTASIGGLTISGGYTQNGGGGITNAGTLTINDSVIESNTAPSSRDPKGDPDGGQGGGILNQGTLTVVDSTIANNSAVVGGGILNNGKLSITGDTIANNWSSFSGGGLELNSGTATVVNSTLSSNSTAGLGGGIDNSGTATVTDSTIANGSAGVAGGGIMNSGSLNVVNATIADNVVASSSGGGGLESYSGTTALDNTIVALNTDNLEGQIYDDNIASVVTLSATSANNLIGTVGIAGGTGGLTNGVDGNRVGVANPGLGPLAGNGGPTQTMALLAGSPAIEHGSVALDAAQTTDQRGAGYARLDRYGFVDIGAYEYFIPFSTHIYTLPPGVSNQIQIDTQVVLVPHPVFHKKQVTSVVLDAQIEPMSSARACPPAR